MSKQTTFLRVILTVAVLLSFTAPIASAVHDLGLFELEGNATRETTAEDWINVYNGTSTALGRAFISSSVEAAAVDKTYFTGGGSKDVNDVSQWLWSPGDVSPDKDQILDAYAAAYVQNGNLFLYFGMDRFANDGDAQAGFWFFKKSVGLNADGSFNGVHTVGDILILSDFTQGGKISTIKVFKWVGSGGSDGPLDLLGAGSDCTTTGAGDLACATVNANDGVPSPWPYTPKQGSAGAFPHGSFFEGGINLSGLLHQTSGQVGCFSGFLGETRSSQSVSAQLKDFALGAFDLCAARISITPPTATNEVGTNHTFTIKVEKKDASTNFSYAPAANVSVSASLTNANGANSVFVGGNSCATNTSGTCTVTISSNASGATTVSASANVAVGDSSRTVTTNGQDGNSAPANKRWVNAKIAINPPSATNEVNQPHAFTATVSQDDGLNTGESGGDSATGFGNAPNGTLVTFSFVSNNAGASFVGGNTCTTNTGSCSVTINSANSGSVTVRATTTLNVGGISLTRATGSGGLNSADANKTYVDARISIALSAVNEVGKPHTFVVNVLKNSGSGFVAASGVKVTVTFPSGAPASVNSSACDAGTDANGNCAVVVNSSVPGVFSAHAAADVNVSGLNLHRETNGASGNSGDATKTYVDARIFLTPNGTNEVGKPHTFVATVLKNTGSGYVPASGVAVNVNLANANGASAQVQSNSCASTDANGQCAVTFVSNSAGVVTGHASANINVSGLTLTRETNGQNGNSGDAVKTYVDAKISIAASAVNEVGKPHTFVVTVLANAGSGFSPASGIAVNVNLANANGASATTSANTCNSTDVNGQCSVTFNSNSAGTVTGHASADVVVGGLTLHRETNGQNGNSADAIKTYADARISIATSAVNEVGKPHTFVVHIEKNAGSGWTPASGVKASVTFPNGAPGSVNSASCDAGTDASGNCSVVINSAVAAVFTAHAATDVSVGGLSLHRETNGQNGNSSDAVKTYIDAKISIAPSGTNEVGKPHTFTVTVLKNPGTGFTPASGVAVTVNLANANGASAQVQSNSCASTDANGQCAITFTSATTGVITGHALADVSVSGLSLHRETNGQNGNSADAIKTYVDARISIKPSATNGVGEFHIFTVHVEKNAGAGFVAAAGVGVTVSFVGATPAIFDTSACLAGTDANGDCQATINSNVAGSFTAHASADVSVGGLSLHRETNGQNGNSGDATKTYVAGSLKWLKVDGAGRPLGGATFQVCRTANWVSATASFSALPSPICFSATDNSAPDADTNAGAFQLNGLVLGRYTIQESAAPAGYSKDARTESVDLSLSAPNGSVANPFVNQAIANGKIAPTQTTCQDFVNGTAADLNELFYGVKSGKINNVAPGVFFYYTKIIAPSASFTVNLEQTKNNANIPFFGIVQNKQVTLYNANCTNSSLGRLTVSNGQVQLAISGATPGQVFIVGAKYDPTTVVGSAVPNPTTVHYDFKTKIGGNVVDQDLNGLDLKQK